MGQNHSHGICGHIVCSQEKRYLLKLKVLYNSKDPHVAMDPYVAVDPYQINNGEWKDDIMLWPPVDFG